MAAVYILMSIVKIHMNAKKVILPSSAVRVLATESESLILKIEVSDI